jgi:hypothetical protein
VAGAQNALLHWDGDRWHQVMEEDYKHGRNHQWESVWARSRSDVWLAGGDLFHFDGTTWSQIATGPWHIKIVAGTPDGALWAIADGEEGGAQYADVLLRSQDGRWFRAETGAAQPIVAVWGVGKAIWAGGDHGMILRRR